MGVPAFFAWLLKNFKSRILLKRLEIECDHFFIDANCAFHPECMKVKESFADLFGNELEDKMFKRITNYLTYLFNFVRAKKTNGVFVDGPAPLAKMVQQRKRRYKSIEETNERNLIKLKHNKPLNNNWNNNVITPGTEFMERLHLELLEYFSKKKLDCDYIYSSYHTCGEGEHKLLQTIRTKVKKTDVVVIYGLDADLIFLAMACQIENVYLLRESQQLGLKTEENELYDPIEDVGQELMYVSIKELKNAFNQEIWKLVEKKNKLDDIILKFDLNTDFTNDLIIICFLLGNDFLPHFPSLSISKGGLDMILDAYVDCLIESTTLMTTINTNLKIKINNVFFALLIERLAEKEEMFFREGLPYYRHLFEKRRCPASDAYSRDIWDFENMKNIKKYDPIGLGVGLEEVWKFNYYEYYFGTSEYQSDCIDELIKYYLEGIIWVTKYYFEKCPDLMWQYPFDHAPFLSDISRYLRKYNTDINLIEFESNNNVTPMIQLLAVLPPASNNMLAKSYRSLVLHNDSPIIDMYPKKTMLDIVNKDLYWLCIPKLPPLDIDRIIEACNKKQLSNEEKIRNSLFDEYMFKKNIK